MAKDIAATLAKSYIRQFASETTGSARDLIQAQNYKELLTIVNELLNNPKSRKNMVNNTLSDWDNNDPGIMHRLEQAVFSNQNHTIN